jgi:hypothetical protein
MASLVACIAANGSFGYCDKSTFTSVTTNVVAGLVDEAADLVAVLVLFSADRLISIFVESDMPVCAVNVILVSNI